MKIFLSGIHRSDIVSEVDFIDFDTEHGAFRFSAKYIDVEPSEDNPRGRALKIPLESN